MQGFINYHIYRDLTPATVVWITLYLLVAVYTGRNVWNRLGDVLWCHIEGIFNGVRMQTFGDTIVETLTLIIATSYVAIALLSIYQPGMYIVFVLLAGGCLKLIRSYISRKTRVAVLGGLQVESTGFMIRRYLDLRAQGKLPRRPRTSEQVHQDLLTQLDDLGSKEE